MSLVRSKPDLPALRTRICQLMPAWRADELHDFAFLPAGYSNDNYRFRHGRDRYVVRLPLGSRSRNAWRRERDFYQSPGAILIPEVVAFDIDSGAMISRWVDGTLLIDAPPTPQQLVAFLQSLQPQLVAMGTNDSPITYDPIAQSRRHLQTPGPERPSPRVERLARSARWPATDLRPCHNDFNPWNVIQTRDGGWVTLDWESRANNDPLFDLVTMHQGLGLADNLLAGLCAELLRDQVVPERIERVVSGFWIREYAWAFAAWQGGNRREELRQQMALAAEKLAGMDS